MRLAINGRFYATRGTGVQRVAREMTTRLCDHADVTIFVPRAVTCPLPENARIVRGTLRGHAWEQLELAAAYRRHRCDILVHLAGPGSVLAGRSAIFVHDVLPITNPEWFARPFARWYQTVMRVSVPAAAHIFAPSAWARQEIARTLGVSAARIQVVPQGMAPFDRPAQASEVARVRRRLDLPDRYVLATGAGDPRKNVGFLHEVMARWASRDPHAPTLVIAGAATTRVHGKENPAPTHPARYVGPVSDDDLRALYTGASLFCYPSLGEGFGRPPLEAMSCGTPAVVANYGCAHEVLGDATPILPLDADVWVDTLARLTQDADTRAHIVARGRERSQDCRWSAGARILLESLEVSRTAPAFQPAVS